MNGMFKSCFGGFLRRKQATLLFCRSASLEATSERGRAESTPDGFSQNHLKARAAGRVLQTAGRPATGLLCMPDHHPCGLPCTNSSHEATLHSQIWLAIKLG